MNATLLSAASNVIPTPGMLINLVRLRVRQLTLGHRPLADTIGLGFADIALTEIIAGKITFVAKANEPPVEAVEAKVVDFPVALVGKKRAA